MIPELPLGMAHRPFANAQRCAADVACDVGVVLAKCDALADTPGGEATVVALVALKRDFAESDIGDRPRLETILEAALRLMRSATGSNLFGG